MLRTIFTGKNKHRASAVSLTPASVSARARPSFAGVGVSWQEAGRSREKGWEEPLLNLIIRDDAQCDRNLGCLKKQHNPLLTFVEKHKLRLETVVWLCSATPSSTCWDKRAKGESAAPPRILVDGDRLTLFLHSGGESCVEVGES